MQILSNNLKQIPGGLFAQTYATSNNYQKPKQYEYVSQASISPDLLLFYSEIKSLTIYFITQLKYKSESSV